MIKSIKKTCIIDEDTIEIKLEDIRDNYIHPLALGKIGTIYISRNGIMMNAETDGLDAKIDDLREKYLAREFGELFAATDYNPLSGEYYQEINTMIEDGTLEFRGYKIVKTNEEDLDDIFEYDIIEYYNHKQDRRR